MNDDELKARFDALRADDQRRAPSLEAVIARRRPTRAIAWTLVPLGALLATAAVVLLVFTRRESHSDARIVPVGLREPEPLAFLLAPVPPLEDSP